MRFSKSSMLTLAIQIIVASVAAQCEAYIPGEVYFGENNYIEYRAGDMPLIIAVPHGGYLNPSEISDRNCSGCVYTNDAFTLELGEELYEAITSQTEGCRPHLIINHLDRRKLDGNRSMGEAADGDPLAEQAWVDFHDFITSSKACVTSTFGKGFFVDLHGHGHTIQRIEYGYLLYEDELALSDETLNTSTYINWSSLRNLATTNVMGLSHAQLLRGTHALGTILANANYPGVPSEQDPFPLLSQPYFSGGYNTVVHSSYQGGSIDGVQIECNQSIRFNETARQEFAVHLAAGLIQFTQMFYASGADLCAPLSVEEYTAQQVTLFPNPGSGSLQIAQTGDEKVIKSIHVFRSDGQFMMNLTGHQCTQPIHIAQSGVYLINVVFSDNTRINKRWVNIID